MSHILLLSYKMIIINENLRIWKEPLLNGIFEFKEVNLPYGIK